jgi:hypothetical protein
VQMGCAGCKWGVLGAGGLCWVKVACARCRWGVLHAGGVCCVHMGCVACRWGVMGAGGTAHTGQQAYTSNHNNNEFPLFRHSEYDELLACHSEAVYCSRSGLLMLG